MERQLILNNKQIITELLKEEEFEDEILLRLIPKKRKPFNSLFSTRKTEGFFKKLFEVILVMMKSNFENSSV